MLSRILAAALLLTACAQAATLRVPGDQPTIQAGIDAAAEGDIVEVAAGTYVEKLNFLGKAIEVRGAGQSLSVVDPSSASAGKARVVTFAGGEGPMSVLAGFSLTGGSANYGGGIRCDGAEPTITDCTISNNTADNSGGGLYCNYFSDPRITDCTISNNKAGGSGGGIRCYYSSDPTMINCTVSDNTADGDAGGIYCFDSSPTIANCTVSNNTADGDAGGVYCASSDPTITNCTISNNTAYDDGGGINCYLSSPTVTNCTISNNTAHGDGGGINCVQGSSPRITNCILWGDAPEEIKITSSCSPAFTYCNVQHGYAGDGNINADPFFADAGTSDFHLTAGSPCIDTGTADGAPDTDFEGDPRPQGNRVDMGADEYLSSPGGLELELTDYRSVYSPRDFLGLTIHIKNSGDEPAGLTKGVFFATSPPSLDYEEALYDGQLFLIGEGSTFTYEWGARIPSSAPLGTYNAGIRIYDGDTEISSDAFDFEIQ